jgi:NADPH-dependent glutamate synthase beta subunit-like oxidoreductase
MIDEVIAVEEENVRAVALAETTAASGARGTALGEQLFLDGRRIFAIITVMRLGDVESSGRKSPLPTGVFAAGDVVTGESLVVKAMAGGREAAHRIREYLMGIDARHISLYDYFTRRTSGRYYRDMMDGKEARMGRVRT